MFRYPWLYIYLQGWIFFSKNKKISNVFLVRFLIRKRNVKTTLGQLVVYILIICNIMRPVSSFESRKKPIYDGSLHVDGRVIMYIVEVKYNNNILCTRYTWSSCFVALLLYRVYSRRKQICIVKHVHFEIRKGRSQRSTLYPSMFEDKNCVKII